MTLKILAGTAILFSALTSFAEESQPAAPVAAPMVSEISPSQGQTSAPVAKVAPEAKKKRLKVGYNFRALYGRVDGDKSTGSVANRNRFTFGYNFDDVSVALRPTWTNTHNVDTDAAHFTAGDLILEASKGGIALNHNWSLLAVGRYYFPTSESSRLLASNGMAFLEPLFTRPIGTRFTAVLDGAYTKTFQNQRTAYAAVNAKTGEKIKNKKAQKNTPQNLPSDQSTVAEGNARYDMLHTAGVEYKINKKWAFTQLFQYMNAYKYGNTSQGVSSSSGDTFSVASYFSYQAAPNLGIDMGLGQDRNSATRAAQPKYTYMADAETQYYLEATLSL